MECNIYAKIGIPNPILQSQFTKQFNKSNAIIKKDIDTIDYGSYQDNEYIFSLNFGIDDILFKMYHETQDNPEMSENNPDYEIVALEIYSQNDMPVDYSEVLNKLTTFKNSITEQSCPIKIRMNYSGTTKI